MNAAGSNPRKPRSAIDAPRPWRFDSNPITGICPAPTVCA